MISPYTKAEQMQTTAHDHGEENPRILSGRLAISAGLTLALVIVEAAAGLWANSLALLTDAAHNVTDIAALALSGYALRLSFRSAHSGKTYGYHRAGILAALVNSTVLVLIALGAFSEAIRRFRSPPEVRADALIVVAAAAFVINLATALIIRRGSHNDLNLRSAFVHLMGDALSTLGAVAAGFGIALTGWNGLDPLAGLLIGALILWNAWGIIRQSVHILLEGTPEDVDVELLVRDLLQVKGVRGVHDLHVWSITQAMRSLSAHIVVEEISVRESAGIQASIHDLLCDKFGIRHATLQMEVEGCPPDLLYCDMAANSPESIGQKNDGAA
jgi:cobalt-zinc-cadmium efflux system protein